MHGIGLHPSFGAAPVMDVAPIAGSVPATSEELQMAQLQEIHDRLFDADGLESLGIAILKDAEGLEDQEQGRLLDAVARLQRPMSEYRRKERQTPRLGGGMVSKATWRIPKANDLTKAAELWRRNVSYFPEVDGERTSPPASKDLLEFIDVYLRLNPGQDTEAALFRTFDELAKRNMPARHCAENNYEVSYCRIAEMLASGLIPLHRLRGWMGRLARDLKPIAHATFQHLDLAGKMRYASWEIRFAALSSEWARDLLACRRMTLDTLVSWTELEAVPQTRAMGDLQSRYPNQITHFLSHRRVNGGSRKGQVNPAALLEIARTGVPITHAVNVLRFTGSVGESILEEEISRATGHYGRARIELKRRISLPERSLARDIRTAVYSEEMLDPALIDESVLRLECHASLYRAKESGRLDTCTIALACGENGRPFLQRQARSVDALFASWQSQGVPIDEQAGQAWLLIQGFSPDWAQRIAQAYAPTGKRLETWFSHSEDKDLGPYLDDNMQAAVARWLADEAIRLWALPFGPSLIEIGLAMADVDTLLRLLSASPDACSRCSTLLTDGGLGDQVRYGQLNSAAIYAGIADTLESFQRSFPAFNPPDSISASRRAMGDILTHLRRSLRHIDTIQGIIPAGQTSRRCSQLANMLHKAVPIFDELCEPLLEDKVQKNPAHIAERLSSLRARLDRAYAYPADAGLHAATIIHA